MNRYGATRLINCMAKNFYEQSIKVLNNLEDYDDAGNNKDIGVVENDIADILGIITPAVSRIVSDLSIDLNLNQDDITQFINSIQANALKSVFEHRTGETI